jgi:hypothetical protein
MRIGNDSCNIGAALAAPQVSEPIWLGHIANYSIQIFFSGTPGGNFKLQMSNDEGNVNAPREDDRDFKIVNWTDIADSAFTVSAAGDVAWNYRDCGYRWVRVVWTPTSGSGTITSIRFNVKGV